MTKGITKLFMGAAMLTSVAFTETDLLAKLSNGALSDKSEGIAELSREQKAKVVGGYSITKTAIFSWFDGDFANPIAHKSGLFINLTQNEIKTHFKDIFNPKSDNLVLITRYHYKLAGYTHNFYIYDKGSGKMRTLPWNDMLTTILQQERALAERRNYSFRFIKY